ncbi:MAG TPA: ASCH domain-containing protein [Pirellulales bacterium]|nr:ASCH domain-containing protein [Pirellulales bacterium]
MRTTQTIIARPTLALSVRQPWCELILLGRKTIECRTRPTNIRGPVWLYASLGRYSADDEAEWTEEYGLDVAGLPRGLLVGTVEIFHCDGCDWHLGAPVRLKRPIKPAKHPQPVWFRPF